MLPVVLRAIRDSKSSHLKIAICRQSLTQRQESGSLEATVVCEPGNGMYDPCVYLLILVSQNSLVAHTPCASRQLLIFGGAKI
jgi:hypothetical protein